MSRMTALLAGSFPRFLIVGGAGFCVDAAVLSLLVNGVGASPVTARLVSFPVAVAATLALNRAWTFAEVRDRPLARSALYVLVQVLGGVANIAVYAAAARLLELPARLILVALALGSAAGLGITYAGSRYLAFRSVPERTS